MENTLWLNLASKDLKSAKAFFEEIGFEMNQRHVAPHMVSMFVGSNRVVVNLFTEELFYKFSGRANIGNGKDSTEVLFSIGASSVDEVDGFAKRVRKAGGELYSEPKESEGWMYGFGFVDLDGHRWNVLYMDMEKMPKS